MSLQSYRAHIEVSWRTDVNKGAVIALCHCLSHTREVFRKVQKDVDEWALDRFATIYDKYVLAGDFNAEKGEEKMGNFLEMYGLKCLREDGDKSLIISGTKRGRNL